MNKFKIISLFSGIGAFERALDKLNVDYEVVNYCEIDKYASKSYSLIHNVPESKNLGDISKVDFDSLPKDIDLVTYGFPCQDISMAGLQKGFFDSEGNLTRSGLFFEALKVIKSTNTKFAIAENVKALTSKTFTNEFAIVLKSLEELGYNNYFQVLNAKDYGMPQNRERVFVVSIRKDIDNGKFEFPNKIKLEKRLVDYLEDSVDKKYYINDLSKCSIDSGYKQEPEELNFGNLWGLSNTVSRKVNGRQSVNNPGCSMVGGFNGRTFGGTYHQGDRLYDSDFISTCLTTGQGGSAVYVVPETDNTLDCDYLERLPNGDLRKIEDNSEITDEMNLCRVRRLTPKECFRLTGFDDADCELLLEKGQSETQIYKRAGNSIVVNVLYYLMKNLLKVIR